MSTSKPNGDAYPGRTIKLDLSAAQVAYLRYLLFRDLQEEAGHIAEHAHSAHESGKFHGRDARDNYRGIMGVTTGLLDAIGWNTDEDVDAINWLSRDARERLAGPGEAS
jgi:hypothetical protein